MKIEYGNSAFSQFSALTEEVKQSREPLVFYAFTQWTRNVALPYMRKQNRIVKAIIDKNPAVCGGVFQDIPVIALDNWQEKNAVVVVNLLDGEYMLKVIEELRTMGFTRLLPAFFYLTGSDTPLSPANAEELVLSSTAIWKTQIKSEKTLSSIDIPITMACSLRCRDCANLMQYFTAPPAASFPIMERAAERLFNLIDYCFDVRILGGEPFVRKNWLDFARLFAAHKNKFSWLSIYTNATIVPPDDMLAGLAAEKNYIVRISDYHNPKQKIPSLTAALDRQGVPYYITECLHWQDCAALKNYGRSAAANEQVLAECCVRDTPSLVDGKLFRCPFAGNLWLLPGAVPSGTHEYVNLLAEDVSDEALCKSIIELMSQRSLKSCAFCGGRPIYNAAPIPAALQAGAPLPYRRY